MPRLNGISHIELTVSDCEQAAALWQDVMGFTQVNHVRGASLDVRSLFRAPGVVVNAMTHDQPLPGVFDERCIGLDHLAFEVSDRDELRQWVTHLDAKGVAHQKVSR